MNDNIDTNKAVSLVDIMEETNLLISYTEILDKVIKDIMVGHYEDCELEGKMIMEEFIGKVRKTAYYVNESLEYFHRNKNRN